MPQVEEVLQLGHSFFLVPEQTVVLAQGVRNLGITRLDAHGLSAFFFVIDRVDVGAQHQRLACR